MCHHATREAHSLPANCSNSKARLSQSVSISTFSPVSAAEFVELLDCCISDLFANFAHFAAIISSSFLVNSRRFMAMESLAKPKGTGSKCRLRTYLIPQSYHSQPSQTRYLAGSAIASAFPSKLAMVAFVILVPFVSFSEDLTVALLTVLICFLCRPNAARVAVAEAAVGMPRVLRAPLPSPPNPSLVHWQCRPIGGLDEINITGLLRLLYTTHHRACEVVIYNLIHVVNHNLIVVNMLSICLGLDVIKAFCQVVILMPNLMLTLHS